jgi:hypothetical protein
MKLNLIIKPESDIFKIRVDGDINSIMKMVRQLIVDGLEIHKDFKFEIHHKIYTHDSTTPHINDHANFIFFKEHYVMFYALKWS